MTNCCESSININVEKSGVFFTPLLGPVHSPAEVPRGNLSTLPKVCMKATGGGKEGTVRTKIKRKRVVSNGKKKKLNLT